jgi:hypothetical protein
MTKQDAENIAKMWYIRTNNLTNYFQDNSKTQPKRAKAFYLASVMFARVCKLEIELTQPSKPLNYKAGGISSHNGSPFINTETSEWVAPNWMIKTIK